MSYRYIGNKTTLTDWIVAEIVSVLRKATSIADPMCGTASVSMALAIAGYSVTASDALTFPVVHARNRLLVKEEPAFKKFGGYKGALEWMGNVEPVEGYFYREFGAAGTPETGRASRLYFSAQNAAHIDGLRLGIASLKDDGKITSTEHSVLLQHLLLSTNKVANITGTYGYFRKNLSTNAMRPLNFEPFDFVWTPGKHQVMQGSVEDLAPSLTAEAVYLDPPYTKRQYAGNYHILETLARGDEPIAVGDGGLRPWADQASDFCYRKRAGAAFRRTLEQLDTSHVFISYSEDGQVPDEELRAILEEFGDVFVHEHPHARYRSNGQVKDGAVLERLYHVEMD